MGHTRGQKAPWQRPGQPLDVTCFCESEARPFPPADIIRGDHGWSCGKWYCKEAEATA